ncbi:hypothetical protein [Catenuloplanes atrovinosus]|uniref:Uncharacterized protein n=1 Tax=Catenuloplanes atrovinosus TaxID=137266 RepID=A0AAE4C916_9ACTN|nr:hypothetical protein [Catenuloplanes atrovinosus]MDR7276101.1 hypothetical protein [Catenuloplanes atrovinosus]
MTNNQPEPKPARRAPSAIAAVVATASGTTALPQLLGLVAGVAQVATLTASNAFLVINLVIVVLGVIALFDPGHTDYRASTARVVITTIAVGVSGVLAGVGVLDRLGVPASVGTTEAAATTPAGATPSAPPVPSAGPTSAAAASSPPQQVDSGAPGIAAPDATTAGPGPTPAPPPPPPPSASPRAVTTMNCRPSSCETSDDLMDLFGAFPGTLADGEQLRLFVQAPDGLFYAGSTGIVSGGSWSGRVHLGSEAGQEQSYTYTGCLYRIDRVFADDLRARGDEELNRGLTAVPTTGSAVRLACRTLVWNRT